MLPDIPISAMTSLQYHKISWQTVLATRQDRVETGFVADVEAALYEFIA